MGKQVVKRKKIGLVFLASYKEWAGGVIYILNIIHALKLIDDENKPELYIYYKSDSPIADIKAIRYPYLSFIRFEKFPSSVKKVLNYASLLLTKQSICVDRVADIVYPDLRHLSFGKKPYHWIADFQDYYLPEMWSPEDLTKRVKYHKNIAARGGVVVFSSEDAMNDFKKFYPGHRCELRLLRFASTLPDYSAVSFESVKKKFGIDSCYFMSPNQFWKHKNHMVVLEAIAMLKDKHLDFVVVFTGSESDHRNKEYFQSLKDFIAGHGIERWVKFLGFIDRSEQLVLMENAISIIQPSLFEGWSTVVEDAKAQSQFIILSRLRVHEEQIQENCRFFDPHSPLELSLIIEEFVRKRPERRTIDYTSSIRKFADDFMEIVGD
jgi:glycosyltransferase involved in cell wall biosynthesis